MEEKRTSQRKRVLKSGRIVFNDGRSVISCTVRNLSPKGALLKVENALTIPAEFILEVDQVSGACRVTRKTLQEIAVEFVTPLDAV